MEKAKEITGEFLWPAGLSDEEERAAWKLIVYKDYIAVLTPEAEQALQGETRYESERVIIADASAIAQGINVYNALNPDNMLPDDVTLSNVFETLEEELIWPSFMTGDEAEEAWGLIEIKDGLAKVKGESQLSKCDNIT